MPGMPGTKPFPSRPSLSHSLSHSSSPYATPPPRLTKYMYFFPGLFFYALIIDCPSRARILACHQNKPRAAPDHSPPRPALFKVSLSHLMLSLAQQARFRAHGEGCAVMSSCMCTSYPLTCATVNAIVESALPVETKMCCRYSWLCTRVMTKQRASACIHGRIQHYFR